jgi:hypothetical protein
MINSRNIVDEEDEEVEEEWGIVSLDGEAQNKASGVLILSGDEASSFNENNAGYPTANDNISIPGTDSIPSEIDTLDIASGLHNVDATDDGNETWRPDDEEQSSVAHASTRSHLKIRAAIFFSVLLVMTLVGYLAWENYSRGIALVRVQEDKLRLEEEVRLLKETSKTENRPHRQNSCNAEDWQEDSESTVLADNCYFRLTLRDCGKNAKESWNDLANGVYQSFDTLGKMAWNVLWQEEDDSAPTARTNSMATEAFSEASSVVASTIVAVHDAFREVSASATKTLDEITAVVDESILRVMERTREAIGDATAPTRPE